MASRLVALVLIASICSAQTPAAQTPASPPAQPKPSRTSTLQSASGPQPTGIAGTTITVPQGSLIALRLITSIRSKSSRPGDSVRAVVAFPLAMDARVAIPSGTYVEGVVDRVNAHPSGGTAATVQLRFNRLLFANGYSAPIVARNIQALLPTLNDPRRTDAEWADARDAAPYLGEAFAGQNPTQPPALPPLPSNGPSPGALAGIGIGAGVGILVLGMVLGHHRATSTDYVLFDSGWQFRMRLEEPLVLDSVQVSAAAAMAR